MYKARPEGAQRKRTNWMGIILTILFVVVLIVLIVGIVMYVNSNSRTYVYDGGATLTLSASDDDTTTIEEGEENVITPDEIELEFTFKSLQDDLPYSNVTTKIPPTGESKILVMPIMFTDWSLSTAEQEQTIEDMNNVFFGDASDTYWESLSSFYYESSFGQLNLSGTVLPWYNSGLRSTQLTDSDQVMNLVTEALEYYEAQNLVDPDDYDSDGDGYIDGLWVIYSAPDYQTGEYMGQTMNSDVYWAYTTWWYDDSLSQNQTSDYGVYGWCSVYMLYYEPYSESSASSYTFWNQFDFTNSSNQLDSHTIVHETGHMLGLNDYYSYTDDEDDYSSPIGCNDMMDMNVCDHNMYSKMMLGWVKPYIITGDCTIELADDQNKDAVIVILDDSSNALTDNGDGTYTFNPFSEYILIEYYVPEGLNEQDVDNTYTNGAQGIDGEGFKVFHIDNRLYVVSAVGSNWNPTYNLEEYDGTNYNSYTNRLYYFISNTNSGDYGEEELLEYYEMNVDGEMSDYYSEISLISAGTPYGENEYNYKQAYVVEIGRTTYLELADEDDLFDDDDVFNMTTYSDYFIYGDDGEFNNGHEFTSNVIFN